MSEHVTRLQAALDAYPQGYTTTADLAAHLLVCVRAADLRTLLGDLAAYQKTFQRIMEDEAAARALLAAAMRALRKARDLRDAILRAPSPPCTAEMIKAAHKDVDDAVDALLAQPEDLFQLGDFALASGARSAWKIECDALTPADWAGLARIASEILPPRRRGRGVG